MTACLGMSTTSTRRVTLTSLSTNGHLTMIPGPLASSRMRPNRKKTARSYSVTTLNVLWAKAMAKATKTSAPAEMPNAIPAVDASYRSMYHLPILAPPVGPVLSPVRTGAPGPPVAVTLRMGRLADPFSSPEDGTTATWAFMRASGPDRRPHRPGRRRPG